MNISTEEVDGVLIVRVREDALDASNAKEFKAQISALTQPGTRLVFDLSRLKFVDSSGLGALLSCLRQVNGLGGAMKLCALLKPVRALFELVRMHRVFEIFNTQEEAILSCKATAASAATTGD